MNKLLQRMATPVSRRHGLQLALIAVVMTASPWVATLWLTVARGVEGYEDYLTAREVYGITWTLASLAIVPLLFATVALVGRPMKPSWLMPLAVALALCQPIVNAVSFAGLLTLDFGLASLLAVVTGCSVGALVAGLSGLDRRSHVGVALLIAVGVAIAAMALLFVIPGVVVALTIAILLGFAIQQRKHNARDAVLASNTATEA